MNTKQTEYQSIPVNQEKLLAFVRQIMGENGMREDDEYPSPPGPWDPIIRVALERSYVSGPQSDPWRAFGTNPDPWRLILASILARNPEIWDVIGGGHTFGDEIALNPQPLPPRFAFLVSLAQTVTSRVEFIHEIADAIRLDGEEQGIIIVGGYISRFIDDICGNDFRFKWPFPGPRPHWYANEIDGSDLVVMATQFGQAAKETYNPDMRQHLANASTKLAETGLSRMN